MTEADYYEARVVMLRSNADEWQFLADHSESEIRSLQADLHDIKERISEVEEKADIARQVENARWFERLFSIAAFCDVDELHRHKEYLEDLLREEQRNKERYVREARLSAQQARTTQKRLNEIKAYQQAMAEWDRQSKENDRILARDQQARWEIAIERQRIEDEARRLRSEPPLPRRRRSGSNRYHAIRDGHDRNQ